MIIILESKSVMCKWVGNTKSHYESKGYKYTKNLDEFEVEVKDLQITSTIRVDVICDYCGEKYNKEYRNYLKDREVISKDCCRKCKNKKQQEIMLHKYGVKNILALSDKEKLRRKYKKPYKEVYELFSNKGAVLLATEDDYYKKEDKKLPYMCNSHRELGIQFKSHYEMQKAKNSCNQCGIESTANKQKLDGNIIFDKFVENGLTPYFTVDNYKNRSIPLPFICNNHKEVGIQYKSYSNIIHAKHCCNYGGVESASKFLREDYKNVINDMRNKNMIPTDDFKYTNKDNLNPFLCEFHTEEVQYFRYGVLDRVKIPCKFCRHEKCITELNRKLRSSLSFWRKESEKQCGYKCILSGSKNYDIHHVYSYNSIIEDSINELNIKKKESYTSAEIEMIKNRVIKKHKEDLGVCLDTKLHELFHSIYGKKNNNKEQFDEFCKLYKNGELHI